MQASSRRSRAFLFIASLLVLPTANAQDQGRMLATNGLLSIDGSAGGGITQWAVLSGYGSEKSWGGAGQISLVKLSDFDLKTAAASVSIRNRLELSVARQKISLPSALTNAGLPNELGQKVYSAKARVSGDLVYGKMPQISIGVNYKKHDNPAVVAALGGTRNDDTDVHIAATKLWADGPGHRFWLGHIGVRYTRSSQLGLLGYGGANDDREWLGEAAVGFFPTRQLAIGAEYRQMPDNIPGISEEDWSDVFIAFFPGKGVNINLARVDAGDIAGVGKQTGWYLSFQGAF